MIDKQLLRLSPWSPYFDPETQKNSHALYWVKFPRLGFEFWEVDSLIALGRTMGTPIHVDRTQSDFGYFAKVLVDIDLAEPIPNKVLVEVEDGDFWQKVESGTLFCPHCKMVGHNLSECRGVRAQVQREEEIKDKRNQEEARKVEVGEDQDTIEEQNQALILVKECKNKDSGIGYTSTSKVGVASTSLGTGVNANSSAGTYSYTTAQLIRETSLVLVNKEENWADMVEDEEKDEACVAKSTSQSKTNAKKAVHASAFKIVRRGLWKEVVTVSQLNLPWLAVGDFNIIRLQSERFGGKFDGWKVKALARENSDHSALVGGPNSIPKPTNIPFRFLKCWIEIPGFQDLVKTTWEVPQDGNPLITLMKKLQRLKTEIKSWRKAATGGLAAEISRCAEALESLHLLIEFTDDEIQIKEAADMENKLNKLLKIENSMWKQKARSKWLTDGERNSTTKFTKKNGETINYFISSSIWNELKGVIKTVENNSRWLIGNGRNIDFWRDCWGGVIIR
ncbi:hypothetical protein GIB67_015692 [Kingdonia uniflora]|uniref:DUF4283 domain-containing protein n=1 Tax=Kingdonia uniflora TaxID=39325 RepID=A0A7J7NUK4_9MAGN|nr:hypothetical protein GIB67_015692 [Kingdonia uniflora]